MFSLPVGWLPIHCLTSCSLTEQKHYCGHLKCPHRFPHSFLEISFIFQNLGFLANLSLDWLKIFICGSNCILYKSLIISYFLRYIVYQELNTMSAKRCEEGGRSLQLQDARRVWRESRIWIRLGQARLFPRTGGIGSKGKEGVESRKWFKEASLQ